MIIIVGNEQRHYEVLSHDGPTGSLLLMGC
jgi:hypothetical protein